MLVKETSRHFMIVDLEEDELFRVLGLLDISPLGVCKVLVSIVRSDLDTEELHARIERRERERTDCLNQGDLGF